MITPNEIIDACGGEWCMELYKEGMTQDDWMLAIIKDQRRMAPESLDMETGP